MKADPKKPSPPQNSCPNCRAQKPFYLNTRVAESEWVSICFACGLRYHQNDVAVTVSHIKHKCRARLFLG